MEIPQLSGFRRVLVSDFDGTMTREDFFERVLEHLAGTPMPDYWGEYVAGRRTHFDALRAIYSHLRGGEEVAMRLARESQLDPRIATAVASLHRAGWGIVVVSAGCTWYIERLLADRQVELPIVSNPGRIAEDGSLEMLPPTDSPFYSPEFGVDKTGVVGWALERFDEVAFAGDGRPDEQPARLIQPERRFARRWLAEKFREDGTAFGPFEWWSEIAAALAGEAANG